MDMPQQMQQAQMYQHNPQTVNGANFVPAPFGATPGVEVSNFEAINVPQDGTNNLNNHLSFGDEYDQIDQDTPGVQINSDKQEEFKIETNDLEDEDQNPYPNTSRSTNVSYKKARQMLSKAIRDID